EKLQLPPDARLPPLNAIVRVAAVVVSVPPHCEVDESVTDKPDGRTSLKATPVRAWFPTAVLLSVKLNDDVAPFTIGFDRKVFVIVGAGAGMKQPVNWMSS